MQHMVHQITIKIFKNPSHARLKGFDCNSISVLPIFDKYSISSGFKV